jgi:AcrR family transcriptional regulator
MARSATNKKWIETGYNQFALEGPDGIQIEKLSRIVELNKSGFYHYFGDIENFCRQLINHHNSITNLFLKEVIECNNVDPEFLNVLIKYKIPIMFQYELVKHKSNPLFLDAYKVLDDKEINTTNKIWTKHISIHENPELVSKFLRLVRDMFYSRISMEKFNYDYLHTLSEEIKDIVTKMLLENSSPDFK